MSVVIGQLVLALSTRSIRGILAYVDLCILEAFFQIVIDSLIRDLADEREI